MGVSHMADGNKLAKHSTYASTDMWWHPYYQGAPRFSGTGEWQGPALLPHDEQVTFNCVADVHYSPAMYVYPGCARSGVHILHTHLLACSDSQCVGGVSAPHRLRASL